MSNFVHLQRRYDKLILSTIRLYVIPGTLQQDDLYQEGLIVLEHSSIEDNVNDPDYRRTLSSRLHHRMQHLVRHHTAECRDWRRALSLPDQDSVVEYSQPIDDDPCILATDPSPDEIVYQREFIEQAANAILDMRKSMSAEEEQLFDTLLHYTEGVPDEFRDKYIRLPEHLTSTMLAKITGLHKEKVKRLLRKIRQRARVTLEAYGLLEVKCEV